MELEKTEGIKNMV